MELYYNFDRTAYAVLISSGYGAGWSSWADDFPEIAYDKRVVEWYIKHNNEGNYFDHANDNKEIKEFFNSLGYDQIYLGGLQRGMIRWIPVGLIWRVKEYDGAENIEILNLKEWNQFE